MARTTIGMGEQDRLGWWPAGVLALSLVFSSSAWALDLDREIQRQGAEASQVLGSLGHDRRPNQTTSKETDKLIQVELRPAATSSRHQRDGQARTGATPADDGRAG
jgi:hypothetical protein